MSALEAREDGAPLVRRGEERTSTARGVFVLVVFALAGLAISAGGLGLAPLAAIGGLGGIVFILISRKPPRANLALLAGGAFLAWAAASFLWSPFSNPEYLFRCLIGAPLYLGFFLLCKDLDGAGRRLARGGVLVCVLSAAMFLGLEAVFSGAVTASYRDETAVREVWRNLGHGLSAWIVIAPAAVVMLVTTKRALQAGVAVAIIGVGVLGGFVFGVSSNLLGLIAALVAGGLALLGARTAIAGLGAVAALGVFIAPAFGLAVDLLSPEARAALPTTWDLRLAAWRFAAELVSERPVFGWGFDASRMVSDQIVHRGVSIAVIPLHPHNLGLHVWLELGLIGASLLAATLVLVSRAAAYATNLTRRQGVSAAAAAAAYIAMAQVSYGMWQEWWLATIAFAASAAALAGPRADWRPDDETDLEAAPEAAPETASGATREP